MQEELDNPETGGEHLNSAGSPDDLDTAETRESSTPGEADPNGEMELFENFPDQEQAEPVLKILDKEGIPYLFEENRMGFDPSFANNVVYQAWVLKLPADRFEEARKCLEEAFDLQDVQLPPDHYLREFSTEELLEVLKKADEWSELDVVMARQMLEEKGNGLHDDEMQKLRVARRTELAKPEKASSSMVASAYLFAFLGGAIGIILGWVLKSSTKTTAFGDKVPSYDEASRQHGSRALILGTVVLVIVMAYVLLSPMLVDQ